MCDVELDFVCLNIGCDVCWHKNFLMAIDHRWIQVIVCAWEVPHQTNNPRAWGHDDNQH